MGTKGKDWPYPIRSDPDRAPYMGSRYIFFNENGYNRSFDLCANPSEYIGDNPIIASKDLVEW